MLDLAPTPVAETSSPADCPLVSFVVPTYNHAHFLAEALDSLFRQDGASFEVIVVDDGSIDDTYSVVARYPDAKLVRQPNRGLAAARNTGLRAASGTYVAFVDADDRLLPNALQTWLELFQRNPDCAFVHGSYRSVDGAWRTIWEPEALSLDEDGFATMIAAGNLIGCTDTVMFRKDRLAEVGGFDESLRANEDYDLYLRLLRRYPAASSGRVVAEYRHHDSNMSRNAKLMLSTGRQVVARHTNAVRGDPELRPLAKGTSGIERYWVRAQLRHLKAALRQSGGRAAAVRQTLGLFPEAPVSFLRETGSVARELLRGTKIRKVAWGSLRRTAPASRNFGYDRGTPIDRFYVERFLADNTQHIRGTVLEIKDNGYTRRFGEERVSRSEVLDIDPLNPHATIVADLNDPLSLSGRTFDCIVLTQTLQLVYDFRTALHSLAASLRPGGVLLLTVPGITPIAHRILGDTWFWAFTRASMTRLMAEAMPDADIQIEAHGNVLAATAFLQGVAVEELSERELEVRDLDYQVIITVRATKPIAR